MKNNKTVSIQATASEPPEQIWRLLSDECDGCALVLFTAPSGDRKTAMREIKAWADAHQFVLPRRENDPDATCSIQHLERVR